MQLTNPVEILRLLRTFAIKPSTSSSTDCNCATALTGLTGTTLIRHCADLSKCHVNCVDAIFGMHRHANTISADLDRQLAALS
jgi:hypothetical protein